MTRNALFILALLFALMMPVPANAGAPEIPYRILAEYPHDTKTSTQGLFFHDGLLYESSGGYGNSFLAIVQPDTGWHIVKRDIDARYFAEGITLEGDTLRMLTWRSGAGFIYDLEYLTPISGFLYRDKGSTTEGWGVSWDGTYFLLSSGTSQITFHRPKDFARITAIQVMDGDKPIRMLNELEYVEGTLLANVWKADRIAAIDPKSGAVTGWLDLAPLRDKLTSSAGTANGIAYDPATRRLFVTGKKWDKLFVIEADLVGKE